MKLPPLQSPLQSQLRQLAPLQSPLVKQSQLRQLAPLLKQSPLQSQLRQLAQLTIQSNGVFPAWKAKMPGAIPLIDTFATCADPTGGEKVEIYEKKLKFWVRNIYVKNKSECLLNKLHTIAKFNFLN